MIKSEKGVLGNESDHVINNGKKFHAKKMSVLECQYFYCSTRLQSQHLSPWNEYMNLSARRGGNHDAANNNNENSTMDHHGILPVFQIKSVFFTVNNVMIEI